MKLNKEHILILAISLLLTHELDAMTNKEWLLLFPFLSESIGRITFVLLHIPMFFFILYFYCHKKIEVKNRFFKFISIFICLHAVIHFIYSIYHPAYTFNAPISHLTIYGSGALSLIYFYLQFIGTSKAS